MMGHRGCRLTVPIPEIAVMQTKAVIKAASTSNVAKSIWNIVPEIMIPLVGEAKEMKFVKNRRRRRADDIVMEAKAELKYEVGTMIEIPPRGAHRLRDREGSGILLLRNQRPDADDLRFPATTPASSFPLYYANKIYESDPFARLSTRSA